MGERGGTIRPIVDAHQERLMSRTRPLLVYVFWPALALLGFGVGRADGLPPAASSPGRTDYVAVFDEVWDELDKSDPYFDASTPENQAIYREHREKISKHAHDIEGLREIVRALSRLKDGHTHVTTRWFLPDKPPPPLPLAGGDPLFRPDIRVTGFRRDDYMRLEFADDSTDKKSSHTEDCKLRLID